MKTSPLTEFLVQPFVFSADENICAQPRCGARTRQGLPCRAKPILEKLTGQVRNGRCRNHGGLSTGPRTKRGKAAIGKSNKRRAAMKETA